MAFCTKCGSKLNDGAAFCPSCGAQVGAANNGVETSGVAVQSASPAMETIPAGKVTYQDVKKADEVVQQAYRYVDIAEEYDQKREDFHATIWGLSFKPFIRIFGLGKTILMFTVWTILWIAVMCLYILGNKGTAVIIAVLAIICLAAFMLRWHNLEKANEREMEKFLQTAEDYLSSHQKELSIIPGEYRFPMATEYLVKIFETGRVDNMKEALNMLDNQLHRWKMESQMQILQAQMSVLQADTQAAMGAATVGLVFDIGSFLMHL